jgi:hypothetical protein
MAPCSCITTHIEIVFEGPKVIITESTGHSDVEIRQKICDMNQDAMACLCW